MVRSSTCLLLIPVLALAPGLNVGHCHHPALGEDADPGVVPPHFHAEHLPFWPGHGDDSDDGDHPDDHDPYSLAGPFVLSPASPGASVGQTTVMIDPLAITNPSGAADVPALPVPLSKPPPAAWPSIPIYILTLHLRN
jgi:hypothetical protein